MGSVGRDRCYTEGLIFYLAPSSGRPTLMAARITRTLFRLKEDLLMKRFPLSSLLLLTAIIAVSAGWYADRASLLQRQKLLQQQKLSFRAFESGLKSNAELSESTLLFSLEWHGDYNPWKLKMSSPLTVTYWGPAGNISSESFQFFCTTEFLDRKSTKCLNSFALTIPTSATFIDVHFGNTLLRSQIEIRSR